MKYSHIISAVTRTPWAITAEKLAEITSFMELAASGIALDKETIQAISGAARHGSVSKQGGAVAVIPMFGTISKRMGMLSEFSGGTSTEKLTTDFQAAMDDDEVTAVVLQIDSPGGSVYGVSELADEIFKARGQGKRIVSVVDPLAASASYWIPSAADELVVTPSGEVGSIGVFAAHMDYSKMEKKIGRHVTLVSAGKYKTEGNPYEPLSEEAEAAIQADVDEYYRQFTDAVARNRGTTSKAVIEGYGQGRILGAKQALAEGLADRIDTFDNVIAGLLAPHARGRSRKRAAAQLAIRAA